MSVPITREIKLIMNLDDQTANLLRTLDLEWGCACRFLKLIVNAGYDTAMIGAALTDVLPSYKRMCRDGVSDFDRLQSVLDHIYQTLKRNGTAPTSEQTAAWCEKSLIPTEVSERLIHG